ncbi:MAG: RNA polymerase sigma factor [Hymenobacteraceae bacterium]|nr:RNA polymerase sigma factor [Hymenobacteraceae bacterium]MDX5396224.1 RNA polymerase sigma factor [Hymenobacteraceae bacterium]MDX5444176.1 RNA polymerase sigma factor [Hymenobacteraceae bacterium]MDX5512287.1 RNA polymerase sigma factor [Hymenobacteraceae bacterium]
MELTLVYTDPNAEVVQRCREGERKAQYELYKLYSKAMFNVSMRIVNDYTEAEDVLQESFVNAFSELNSYKGDASFGSWLKRIVVNKSISKLRSRRLQWVQLGEQDYPDEAETVCEEDTAWQVEQIRRCIQQLPDGYRVVLTLYLLEGYDHGEISEILNISEATSKSQYHRAKKKLLELVNALNK